MTEYGGLLRDIGQKQGRLNSKRTGGAKVNDKSLVRDTAGDGTSASPESLLIESKSTALHNRHAKWPDKVVDRPQGKSLLPIG
jgi:hypothetical protein